MQKWEYLVVSGDYDKHAIDADFEREDAMMQHVPALSDLFEKYNWGKK